MKLNVYLISIIFGCKLITSFGFLKTNKMNVNGLQSNPMILASEKIDEKNERQLIENNSFNFNSKIIYENDFFTYQIFKPIIYVIICEILVLPSFFAYHNFLEMIKNTSNNESVAIIANNFF